jgi:hypothetical protein
MNNDNHPMPIFICPSNKKEETVDDILDEFGEPKKEILKPKKDPIKEIIGRIKKSVSPAVVEAIDSCDCFISLWCDPDTGGYCDELECDLRPFCEQGYHDVNGFEHAPTREEVEKEVKEEKQKKLPKPYIDRGWPTDKFVDTIWQYLNKPPAIEHYEYGKLTTLEDRWESQQAFIAEFGEHLQLIRRSSYHMYFYKGIHIVRLWTNTKKGFWIDLHRSISKSFGRLGFKTRKVPIIDRKLIFKLFNCRTYINSHKKSIKFAETLLKYLHKIELI